MHFNSFASIRHSAWTRPETGLSLGQALPGDSHTGQHFSGSEYPASVLRSGGCAGYSSGPGGLQHLPC